jgi:hypothetical protein
MMPEHDRERLQAMLRVMSKEQLMEMVVGLSFHSELQLPHYVLTANHARRQVADREVKQARAELKAAEKECERVASPGWEGTLDKIEAASRKRQAVERLNAAHKAWEGARTYGVEAPCAH